MVPPVSMVSQISLDYCSISGWIVFTEIFKELKSINIFNNIQTVTFTNNTRNKYNQSNYNLTEQ